MDRAAPLVPVEILIVAIALSVVGLYLAGRRPIRARYPWLFPELLALAMLGALHLLFFWRVYRTSALVPAGGGDLASFFYPMHAFAAREIEAGRLPVWNPHQYAGAPHLGNFQAAVIYPPNLIAYFIPGEFSYARLEFLALSHFLLASIGGYWLARALGIGRLAGVFAGGIFAYSGFMVAHLGHYSMLSTAAWAPLLYAGIVAAVRRRSWPFAMGIAPILACCILGGHQPILLMIVTGAVGLALFEIWRLDGGRHPREWGSLVRSQEVRWSVLQLTVPVVLAAGMSAVALGPAIELMRYSSRAGLDYRSASDFAVEPLALLHLVLPTIYGSNPTDFWGPFSSTEIWGYAGVVTLLLAAFGLAVRASRTSLFWASLALVSLLYALGPYTPLHGWIYAFAPGYDRIRAAGRALLFFDLAVALLAAAGLAAIMRNPNTWKADTRRRLRFGLIALAGLVAIVAFFVIPLFAVEVLGVNDPSNRPMIALDNFLLLTLFLFLALVIGLAVHQNKIGGAELGILLIMLALLDIFRATAPFNPSDDPILQGFDHPEAVAFLTERLDEGDLFRIESLTPAWQPDAARIYGLEDIGGLVDPLALEHYQDYLNRARADRGGDLYRNLNVRYILTGLDASPPAADVSQALKTDRLLIWEVDDWRSRAWFQANGERLPVGVEQQGPNRLKLDLPDSRNGGRLVVSQAWYPGWKADIGDRTVDVERHDTALQAVDVPPGVETITLSYRPSRLTAWAALSAASTGIWVVGMVITVRRGRNRGLTA